MSRARADPPFAQQVFATMGGLAFVAALLFGAVRYAGRFGIPIDRASSSAVPIAVNAVWLSVFALHHSIFARVGVKTWIAAHVAPALDRSVYVWISSALFALTIGQWRPVPGTLWHLSGAMAAAGAGVQILGVAGTAIAARRLGVLQLAGLQPPRADRPPTLGSDGVYGIVRHPIYLAWFLMVWGAPVMTATRAEFAVLTCLYLVVAIPFEERDLRRTFGDAYADYSRRVRWRLIPLLY